MPKEYIECVKAVSKRMKHGQTKKFYWKDGKKIETSPYAICRKATGYYGSTRDIGMIHPLGKKRHKR